MSEKNNNKKNNTNNSQHNHQSQNCLSLELNIVEEGCQTTLDQTQFLQFWNQNNVRREKKKKKKKKN